MGGISGYLEIKGVQSITLVGDSDLIKAVILELHYSDKIWVSGAFSDRDEVHPLRPLSVFTSIHGFTDAVTINDNAVLVCNVKSDKQFNEEILKIKKIQIIELSEMIHHLYMECLLYKPLYEFMKRNRHIPLVLCFVPKLWLVENRSENEKKTIKNKFDIIKLRALLRKGTVDKIPEAIKRYSSNLEYAKNTTDVYLRIKKNGIYRLADKQTPYVNVIDGARKTFYQPDEYDGTVYFFGSSYVFGIGAEDEGTIPSHLQQMLNRYTTHKMISSKRVLNYANIADDDFSKMFPLVNSIQFQKNDIIIIVSGKYPNLGKQYGFMTCETQKAFNRPHDMGEVFIDTSHLNSEGYKKVAECLFETFLQNDLLSGNYQNKIIPKSNEEHHSEQKNEYSAQLNSYKTMLSQTREQALGKIGSIVMNCNPFTLGHRYLIEYAVQNVKHLFIFVVEEDKSIFPFKDRLKLVKAGTADMENVTVLPSGQFIISSLTFADYFDKAEIQDRVIDPSHDVELFAKEIAPTLGITIRFAGEEPLDNITRQYNDAMRRILPQYGITFEVIPRKENGGEVISASRVRKFLETKDFEAIAKIVPETTLSYLKSFDLNIKGGIP